MSTPIIHAIMIAEFAAWLDEAKGSFPRPILTTVPATPEAGAIIEQLHALARHVAGARAGEIYRDD